MLDTNQVSDIVRGRSAEARRRLNHLKFNEVVSISMITEAELLYGIAKRPQATALRAAVHDFLEKTEILPWDHEASLAYSTLRYRQESLGKPLAAMDLLIAAHAIATNSTLVSRDKAFVNVSDLPALVRWSTDIFE